MAHDGLPNNLKPNAVLSGPVAPWGPMEEGESLLPPDYVPKDSDVVCGRGKGTYNRPGNRRFRHLVRQHIPEYMATKTRYEKSILLGLIVDKMHSKECGYAKFVKQDKNKRWYEISEEQAREKAGHTLREALASIDEEKKERSKKSACKSKTSPTAADKSDYFS